MVKPIRPEDLTSDVMKKNFPEFVLVVFNELIAKNYRNGQAKLIQDDVVEELLRRSPERLRRDQIFDNHWLDVEEIYRAEGWDVEYDKPAYCESYPAYFVFSKRKSR